MNSKDAKLMEKQLKKLNSDEHQKQQNHLEGLTQGEIDMRKRMAKRFGRQATHLLPQKKWEKLEQDEEQKRDTKHHSKLLSEQMQNLGGFNDRP